MINLVKRLGIFCAYDSEGIIDEYIFYMLREMKKVLAHLAIVCNGKLTSESRNRLEKITADIFVRDNFGFDMEAWRQGVLNKKNELKDYDEIVICNDSFYGPLYPAEEIFAEMYKRHPEADFWGLTIHGKTEDQSRLCPYGYIPEHIQTFFLVVRARMLHSLEFIKYWEDAKVASSFDEAIMSHEVCFTKIFFDKGFNYAVYCDTRDWEKFCDFKANHYLLSTEKLLKEYHCPVIKKKVFFMPRNYYINDNCGDGSRKSLEFIKNNTNYDIALIWKNLLRLKNIGELKSTVGLNYIFPANISAENFIINFSEVAVVAHLYYEDLMPECVKYLCNTPKEVSIFVTVDNLQKKKHIEKLFQNVGRNCEVRLVAGRGRDLAALLVGCRDIFSKFKYLCFVHDKKSLRQGQSIAVGESFFHVLWNNTLTSENFVRNIIATFENEKNLGLLVPPPPHHGEYRFFIRDYWTSSCFDKAVELAENLNIPKKFFNRGVSPLAIGSVFWCRTEALKKIYSYDWKIEDFPAEPMPDDGTINHALERIFPFAAQSEGFYTGWLMAEDFARDMLENYINFSTQSPIPQVETTPLNNFSPSSNALENQMVYQYFLKLTTLECFKFFLQSRIPPKFWSIFRPFKNLIAKLGFKV